MLCIQGSGYCLTLYTVFSLDAGTGPLYASWKEVFPVSFCSFLAECCRHLVEEICSSPCFFLTTQTKCRQWHNDLSLTQMASFALFPSIASVFTLKSTPDQSQRRERGKTLKGFKWSSLNNSIVHKSILYMYVCVLPIVADCSGSKVSSVNLRRRLSGRGKIIWK